MPARDPTSNSNNIKKCMKDLSDLQKLKESEIKALESLIGTYENFAAIEESDEYYKQKRDADNSTLDSIIRLNNGMLSNLPSSKNINDEIVKGFASYVQDANQDLLKTIKNIFGIDANNITSMQKEDLKNIGISIDEIIKKSKSPLQNIQGDKSKILKEELQKIDANAKKIKNFINIPYKDKIDKAKKDLKDLKDSYKQTENALKNNNISKQKTDEKPVEKQKTTIKSTNNENTKNNDIRNVNGKNFRKLNGESRSFYMNQNYLFTDTLLKPTLSLNNFKEKPEIQKLILHEFQPYQSLTIGDCLPGGAIAEGLSVVGQAVGDILLNGILNVGKMMFTNDTIDAVCREPSKLYSAKHDGHFYTKDPIQQLHNMFFKGKWLNTYELPFWENTYLKGSYASNWKNGGVERALGNGLKGIAEKLGVDYPANPKFEVSMSDSRREKITTEFYLINSNTSWLKRNFEFIQAIFAGTSWVHLKNCVIQSPNVYNVICPGRFQMIWAAMNSEITVVGKLRKNKEMANYYNDIKSINEDTLWPDAWKIKLEIQDLTVNNFNNYAEYYQNGFNKENELMHNSENGASVLKESINRNDRLYKRTS